ncbi:uncharacterized protein METZ01_LOCUS349798 [marine metagenome]|uniref:Uncharacterized protein n=1 Tax=marine metagenome TaxID=408172 RepID=A0A382RGU6_9ZZZZ
MRSHYQQVQSNPPQIQKEYEWPLSL